MAGTQSVVEGRGEGSRVEKRNLVQYRRLGIAWVQWTRV
jgi:hypothetical protein